MTREEQIQRESEIYAWTANQFDCGLAFRKGAEWADKTMLDRACEWLESMLRVPLGHYAAPEFADCFRKAMMEEQL